MTNRIFRAIFLVALSVMLSVSVLIIGMMYRYSSVEMTGELEQEAAYISRGLEKDGIAYLKDLPDTETRITWIRPDGAVLFDSVAEADEMENHLNREEVQEALKHGRGESERDSRTLSERTIYFALRLADGSVLRLAIETMSIWAIFFTMTFPLVLILAGMVGVSLFLAFRTAKNITSPINEIDLEHPDRAEVYEELSPLLRRIAVQNREIHRQMAELTRRKEEFDTITAHMQEGLLALDADGNVLSYNDAVLRLLGIETVREGENVFSLNRSEAFRRGVEKALAGTHREERLEVRGKICQVHANPVFREGKTAGVILILFDVTEKEERERLRREFTANVSHELKTPLTSISGFAEIMKSGMVRQEDMGNFAGKIYEEAQRLIDMVQDIIQLSRLDEKEMALEKRPVSVDAIVQEVCQRLEPQAEKQQVRLLSETVPATVFGVPQVLTEVIYNLTDNALRYNHPNGEVRIRMETEEDRLLLTVVDTGIGIAKEEQDRIFERFYRVDSSRSAQSGGTGLGLSIVKHGVALHDGEILLESELGKGTTIRIFLPMEGTAAKAEI